MTNHAHSHCKRVCCAHHISQEASSQQQAGIEIVGLELLLSELASSSSKEESSNESSLMDGSSSSDEEDSTVFAEIDVPSKGRPQERRPSRQCLQQASDHDSRRLSRRIQGKYQEPEDDEEKDSVVRTRRSAPWMVTAMASWTVTV
jgi:hypothetical protein